MSYVVSVSNPESVLSREVLQLMEHQDPSWLGELRLLGDTGASDVFFRGEPINVRAANAENRQGVEIAINGNTDDLTAGAVVVGLAEAGADSIVVHPNVNSEKIDEHRGIVHVPEASVAAVAIIGKALGEPIQHITGSMLLPVSTLGPEGIEELYGQTIALFNQEHIRTDIIGDRLSFNVLPSEFELTGLDSLLDCPALLSMVRVPVFGGTMLLLDYWLDNTLDTADATQRLSTSPVIDIHKIVQPADIVGHDAIRVLTPVVQDNHVRVVAVVDEIRRNASSLLSVADTICTLEAF